MFKYLIIYNVLSLKPTLEKKTLLKSYTILAELKVRVFYGAKVFDIIKTESRAMTLNKS